MSKGIGCAVVVVIVLVVLGLALAGTYNNLVGLSQAVDAQWAQVESVYQRRADLIPNLVSTVQGAANFEKSTLEAVTQARASVGQVQAPGNITNDPAAFAKWQASQDALSGALSRLLVVVERYPELKADGTLRELSEELTHTENRIAFARQAFNDSVLDYNNAAQQAPANVVAGVFGFRAAAMLQATSSDAEREVPRIKL